MTRVGSKRHSKKKRGRNKGLRICLLYDYTGRLVVLKPYLYRTIRKGVRQNGDITPLILILGTKWR